MGASAEIERLRTRKYLGTLYQCVLELRVKSVRALVRPDERRI